MFKKRRCLHEAISPVKVNITGVTDREKNTIVRKILTVLLVFHEDFTSIAFTGTAHIVYISS